MQALLPAIAPEHITLSEAEIGLESILSQDVQPGFIVDEIIRVLKLPS